MHLNAQLCQNYYCEQVGGNYFQGLTAYQRGSGLFGDIRRFVSPLAIKVGSYLGKHALRTGKNVLTDVASGKTFKESARSRFGETSKRIKADILQRLQHGKGIKRKNKRKVAQTKRKRRKLTTGDIFSR